ncbi:MAG: flagellar basal body rod protein FlgB [Deltaproteobacteria bacterium]|nr:flagellar basal body rod protein FlgB [Deltaproteobacteria bacterium]MCB9479741.1 flagellar basal body rod protein FlgB [Deltaproteobacteria bacterium]MCB9487511.1 flagellar basal body rod protein FlgB [Deltaproteobacteria bacterium]
MASVQHFLFDDPTMRLLSRSMDVQMSRVEVVSSNLANLETPDYRALTVDFDSAFKSAIRERDPETMTATNPRHMGFDAKGDGMGSIRFVEREGAPKVDGNDVDLDTEMSTLAHAQLQYSASVAAMQRKIGLITTALKSNF